jgi:hypothetical protein
VRNSGFWGELSDELDDSDEDSELDSDEELSGV